MSKQHEKIAIVGISCLFPDAFTPDAFWKNLIAGKRSASPATKAEIGTNPEIFFDPTNSEHDTSYFLQGSYIRGFSRENLPEGFDNPFVWSLYVAQQALEDAGYLNSAETLKNTGLILGNLSFPTRFSHQIISGIYSDALSNVIADLLGVDEFSITPSHFSDTVDIRNSLISGQPATFVAQLLGLGKTHFAIDAACASSLYAVGLACQYLQNGSADMMLAGAVQGADPLFVNMGFTHFGAYPNDPADNRPLDATSRGLINGEGAGMFVLKRYSDAIRDGDHIYAVIAGIGLTNDGRGKHPLTPNPQGQVLAFQRAYTDIAPDTVQYVECHASGTPVGDSTEINSMATYFGEYDTMPLIGSVKSNVGHLLTAAGAASILKVILSMEHDLIPGTYGVQEPLTSQNGHIGNSHVVVENTTYPAGDVKRAGINAFGFGGVSAHIVLEQPQATTQETTHITMDSTQQKLAIVGMDAQFGDCIGLSELARTIYDGKQHFKELPATRWKGLASNAPQGAYIDAFELDFMRFKLPPKDDSQPIPQQLLLLKVADNALRDANLPESGNVAVIVALGTELSLHQFRGRLDLSWQIKDSLQKAGIQLTNEQINALENITKDALNPPAQVNQYTSFIGNIVSSRVSALWNLSGPAFTLSADENSTYKAIEIAQLLLKNQEVDAVVVGAVDLAGSVENIVIREHMSPSNDATPTMSFDETANGWLVGEGAGAVVLKRAEDATNDRVYAQIDALALVQSQNGITADTIAQSAQQAIQASGLSVDQIEYLEACASGIPDEDEAEIRGLNAVYNHAEKQTALGSVKANIGNSFNASGIASIIKTALVLYHRILPPVPNWSQPKYADAWQNSQFYVLSDGGKTWFNENNQPRHAAISGLGADGTAAHLILSEVDHNSEYDYLKHTDLQIFLVDADTQAGLIGRLGQLETAVNDGTPLDIIASRAFNVFNNRQFVVSLVARNAEALLKEINAAKTGVRSAFDNGKPWLTPSGSYFTANPVGKDGKVAFVYPGAFNSYPGLGRDLLHLFPTAHDHYTTLTSNPKGNAADTLLYQRSLNKPSRAEIRAFRKGIAEDQTAMMESGTAFSILFTHVLRNAFNIKPDFAFGYSIGEGSMMWAMDVWQSGDKASQRFRKSPLFKSRLYGRKEAVRKMWGLPESSDNNFWASYVITAPYTAVLEEVALESRVYITHINTPNETVIAGLPEACERVIDNLPYDSVRAPFEFVIHNETMISEFDEFVNVHNNDLSPINHNVVFYSAADYTPIELDQEHIARSIARVSCKMVDFPRLIDRLYADGARIFIELGAGSTCARWISDTLDERPHLSVAIDNLRSDNHTTIVKMLARLISHGVPMNLQPLYSKLDSNESDRKLIRQIVLGGEPIQNMILTEQNRRLFAQQSGEHSAPVPTAAPVTTVEPAPAKVSGISDNYLQTMKNRMDEIRRIGEEIRSQIQQPGYIPEITPAEPQAPVETRPSVPAPAENFVQSPAIFTHWQVDQFARGSIAACFGEEYKIFDESRQPRIPNTDLMLVTRATEVEGERMKTKVGSSLVMEYDVPVDMWFYTDNSYPFEPYSMIMEMALQPCGFLSAFMGPTFAYPDIDFYFRNLDGHGKLVRDVDIRGRTISNRVTLLRATSLQGMIIQSYSFDMMLDGESFYVGESTFGYFTAQAFANQAGLDKTRRPWWHVANQQANLITRPGNRLEAPSQQSFMELPEGKLAFVDELIISLDGGTEGKGYIFATNDVHESDWYFRCHFYQDPVMPGSLGLEIVTQAMQAYAIEANLGKNLQQPHFTNTLDSTMTWKYRGQVLSDSKHVYAEVNITDIEQVGDKINVYANASIWKGELRIYEFTRVGISITES